MSSATRRPIKRALVSGCAGFLGSHLSERLLARGVEVIGVDRFSDYYDPWLKERNVQALLRNPSFGLVRADLARDPLQELLDGVDTVFHLAARAGVRGSFGDAFAHYLSDNVMATQRLLEASVGRELGSFVYASSSSVYGHAGRPVAESAARCAVSAYGATKMACEDLAGVYYRTEALPVIGMRYFTVYGPRQRPDMAFTRFIARALRGEAITVYGDGLQLRDFTYVDDAIEATIAAAERGRAGTVYNIGAGTPTELSHAIATLEELLGIPIRTEYLPSVRGDARHTNADGLRALLDLSFEPTWSLRDGLAQQVEWMRELTRTAGREFSDERVTV